MKLPDLENGQRLRARRTDVRMARVMARMFSLKRYFGEGQATALLRRAGLSAEMTAEFVRLSRERRLVRRRW